MYTTNGRRVARVCARSAAFGIGLATALPFATSSAPSSTLPPRVDQLIVVDCLLPGQVRKLGGSMTYLSPQRAVKTTGSDCEILGGEYVAYDRANYATALLVWRPPAEQGDPKAQTYVGEIFEKGLGQAPDYAMAASWYQKAADQGFARAQANLAYLYEQGLGVPKDPVKALNLYRKSTGIVDDDLTFASEVTAVRTEMQGQIDELTAQLETQNQESESLKATLASTQEQLEARKTALAAAQHEAAGLKGKVAELQAGGGGVSEHKLAELKTLEADLRAREQKIAQERAAVASLEQNSNAQQAQLSARLEAAAQQEAALRKQLGEQSAAADIARSQLAAAQARLKSMDEQVGQLNAALAAERGRFEADKARVAQAPAAANPTDKAALASLKAALGEREARIAAQAALIASLQTKKQQYDADVTRLKGEAAASAQTQHSQAQELATAQARLKSMDEQVGQLNAALAAERGRFEADKLKIAQAPAAANAADKAALASLKTALGEREARIAAQAAQIASLQTKKQQYDADVTRLKGEAATSAQAQHSQAQELAGARAQLASAQERLLQSEQRLAQATVAANAERDQLAAERRGLEQRRLTASAEQQKEIVRLTQTLADREAKLIEQRSSIAALEAESASYREQVAHWKSTAPPQLAAMRSAGTTTAVQPALKAPVRLGGDVELGNYYALIIGNNQYQFMPTLGTAVNDSQAVEKVLKAKYGFKTQLLLNATRADILVALNDYKTKLTSRDNLLVYYAGHGELDQKNLRGYWLPVNAKRDDTTEWISDRSITDQIGLMAARHVLVVADSCYSGAMTRASGMRLIAKGSDEVELRRLSKMAKLPSRTVLTSGGDSPVLDAGGSGGTSIFARAFVDMLNRNDRVLEGAALYNGIFDEVRRGAARFNVEQSPRYSVLADAGHLNGEFLFVPLS